jgi:hypothetical protein
VSAAQPEVAQALDTRAAIRCPSEEWREEKQRRAANLKYAGKLKLTLSLVAVIAIAGSAVRTFADDDWDAVPSSPSADTRAAAPAPSAANPPVRAMRHHAKGNAPAAASEGSNVILACGEKAVAPSAKIQSIVSQINGAWGSNVQVYQSVAVEGPHSIGGGCIFYNPAGLAMLLGMRLNLNDPNVLTPMLYAIFAHEVGHELHLDFDASRASVSDQIKELEADRFAGYTMKKLDVPATGLSPYWSMTGDEFGAGVSHGSSAQRVAAFKEGWHEAEWNRAENAQSVTAALEQSIAPEDSTAAP